MADSSEASSPIGELTLDMIPTEIYYIFFNYVPPKDLIRSREVSSKWREIIDVMLKDDSVWERFCRRDYSIIYKKAMWKTPNITTWAELYRSLSLWPKLAAARETIDEFCHSDTIDEEMRSAVVQGNGVILVHKRSRVVYHNLLTLNVARRKGFAGQNIALREFEDVVIMLGLNGQLHIVNKPNHNWTSDLTINTHSDDEIWFENVKSFIIGDRTVFYSTYHHDIYSFHLDNDKKAHRVRIPEQLVEGIPDGLGAMGYSDGCFYILTMSHNMYMYVNRQVTLKFKLSTIANLMHCLYLHNMLEDIDWRHYYIILSRLKHKQHTGMLQYISKMQIYANNVFFVGSQSGIINVYYRPFSDGQLNLEKSNPIKVYNFTARIDIPILSAYPIVNIEVTETKEGHIVLVCMQRKILAITYVHEFPGPASKAIVPFVAVPELSA